MLKRENEPIGKRATTLCFYISNWGQAPALKVAYFFKIFRAKSCVAVAYKFNQTQLSEKSKHGIHRIFYFFIYLLFFLFSRILHTSTVHKTSLLADEGNVICCS